MNTTIAPSTKLRRKSEHLLFGKPVWVERDPQDGMVFICDDKSLSVDSNFWWVSKSDLTTAPKTYSTIPVKKKKLSAEELQAEYELDMFYKSLWKGKGHFKCENCRAELYAFSNSQQRAVSAHILPKTPEGGFPSIAMNEDNIIYLGCMPKGSACNCHGQYDTNVANRKKMNVYQLVLKRFELLKPHLTEHEIQKAEEYLGLVTKHTNLAKELIEQK